MVIWIAAGGANKFVSSKAIMGSANDVRLEVVFWTMDGCNIFFSHVCISLVYLSLWLNRDIFW
jgi:hypothetical protein